MGETSDKLASEINRSREDLKANLQELENRVKAVTDWRAQFRRHPGAMIVVALVGGVLLSSLIGKRGMPGPDSAGG